MESGGAGDDCLAFEVNGRRFELPEIDPSTTLLDFLRSRTPFKSVKLGCGEGGCGACVVAVSKYDSTLKKVETFTVSSCLTLICSINGCSITTSEGLGNAKTDFTRSIKALANAEKSQLAEPPNGFSKITASEAEKAIAGNLCRCTGYRPIADACKSFAADVDLEDLGINSFWRKGDKNEKKVSSLPLYSRKDHACSYMGGECRSTRLLNSKKNSWYSPASVEELHNLLHSDTVVKDGSVKLVVGNTANGYYKETEVYDIYIDLRYIPELSVVKRDESGIELGAALSISKVVVYLRENSESGEHVFSKIADHMEKVAAGFVRNSASLGGNLIMAQKKYFPSDIVTLLLVVGASVSIMSGHKHEKITMEEFLSRPPLDSQTVLFTVHIPFLDLKRINGSVQTSSRFMFETYRAAPRPLGNALPYLNAAILADIFPDTNGSLVNNIQLAFGAYGTKHATRARKVEEYLTGKVLSLEVLDEATKLLKGAVVSEEGTSHAAYRSSLAVGFLFEFLNSFSSVGSAISGGLSNKKQNDSLLEGAVTGNQPLLSSAKQVVESSREYHPVGEPMPKFGAAIQASGEAVFVDDIPSPTDCLYGAIICSTKPLARVKGISIKNHPRLAQAPDVITAKDIPKEGKNVGCLTLFGGEPLFADDIAKCCGDIIALVVADTQKNANLAAKNAVVDYDTAGLDPPILTVEEAVERSSFYHVPPFLYPQTVGDFAKGMAEADHKILSDEIRLGSQYYFYMETQRALAVPDEDNCMVVYTSSQSPKYAHRVIAQCLGVPEHNVRVHTRRVGGGFGGKSSKAMPISTACALAAYKLQRPVRMYLDRKTDMIIAGGRHPMKITYSVGFKSDGKITALHLDVLVNAGMGTLSFDFIGVFKKYDWGALSFDFKICRTNHSSKSAMRAPGEVQASYIAEAIIENVASWLAVDVDSIRNRNLHSYESLKLFCGGASGESDEFTLPSIWDKVASMSNFDQRILSVEQFNRSNLWLKRGISRLPIVHEVLVRSAPGKVSILWDGSIVVEVGGIEIGQGLWTKVKQVVAYALGQIQCDGTEDLFDKVRVVQMDTLSLIQGGSTAGSTTSESSCAAVRLCCSVLVERLTPLKETLKADTGSVDWKTLILQANYAAVNLAANSLFVPDPTAMKYLNYGAAVSEVEVDILTGGTKILRTDIVYDCGQSMNPAVDLGQIEGAFVQGLGFFMQEEYSTDSDGTMVADGTWTYKIPTIDTIPKQFNVQVLNSGHHQQRVLSSKASGEPLLLLAASVHCATRAAIGEARKQLKSWGAVEGTESTFQLDVPATMPAVKQLCGLDSVETYLQSRLSPSQN
ncbi:aryl-alcohol oxidase 3 [Salvia divinorum]|uniref:indole-3-acetaldehyde oxidase n=1 Tax=Salvia divinorum TaxID=28513 RepID=A0ABD1H8V6_SALDI